MNLTTVSACSCHRGNRCAEKLHCLHSLNASMAAAVPHGSVIALATAAAVPLPVRPAAESSQPYATFLATIACHCTGSGGGGPVAVWAMLVICSASSHSNSCDACTCSEYETGTTPNPLWTSAAVADREGLGCGGLVPAPVANVARIKLDFPSPAVEREAQHEFQHGQVGQRGTCPATAISVRRACYMKPPT